MKITKEILRDYKDFKIMSNNKTLEEKKNGQIDYIECPFCETGNGAVEYNEKYGFLFCLACNHWWFPRKPDILINIKQNYFLYFLIGLMSGQIIVFFIAYLLK